MTFLRFLPNQPVIVAKGYNQFTEGEQYRVATTNRINGLPHCVLKTEDGQIKGALPQDNLIEK